MKLFLTRALDLAIKRQNRHCIQLVGEVTSYDTHRKLNSKQRLMILLYTGT